MTQELAMSQTDTAENSPGEIVPPPSPLDREPTAPGAHEDGGVTPEDEAQEGLSPSQLVAVECLVSREPGESMEDVATRARVSRRTLYRYLRDPAFAAEYRQRLALTASTDRGRMLRALVEAGLKPGPGQAACQRLFWQLQGDVRDLVSLEVSGPEGGPVQVETQGTDHCRYVPEELADWFLNEVVDRNTPYGNPLVSLWWASPELRALVRAELKLDMVSEPRNGEILRESTRQAIMRDIARANAHTRDSLKRWQEDTAKLDADYAEKYHARSGGHDLPPQSDRVMAGDRKPGEKVNPYYAQVFIEHHLREEGIELYLDSAGNIQSRQPELIDQFVELRTEKLRDEIIEYLRDAYL
jgi:AcrR family transcriptional regulator